MRGLFGTGALALIVALGAASQGCVSLHTYDDQKRRIQALEAAYQGADTMVGNYRDALDGRDARIAELEAEMGEARSRVEQATEAVAAHRSKLQSQYEDMLGELRAEGGGTFVVNESTGGVVLENDIFFAPGQAELKQDALGPLDELIAELRKDEFADAIVEIAGHTDSDPISRSGWDDNYQLAAERARAVLLHFRGEGISAERIYLSGYGPYQPRSSDKSENRRVEIVLHDPR